MKVGASFRTSDNKKNSEKGDKKLKNQKNLLLI